MSTSKYLINSVESAVNDSLSGFIKLYPHLDFHEFERVVLSPEWTYKNESVAIISGGGSGHEPFAAGYVGAGMLAASVAGSIYAAPPSSNILHAIKCVTRNSNAGCLVIIPNYTGDCLNFGLAIEKAKTMNLKIADVIVGEDCSIPESELGRAGKRGLPGILFVIKIAGALSKRGHHLDEIAYYAKMVADNIATCSVGIEACTLPGQGRMFEMAKDEMEFGQGLHGEAGYKKLKLRNAAETVSLMLEPVKQNLNLEKGDSIAVLINNFGALSQLEQLIVTKEVVSHLENFQVKVLRIYSGMLMTSLNGSGVHLTVFKLPKKYETILLSCLDEKTSAPCWPGSLYSILPSEYQIQSHNTSSEEAERKISGPILNAEQTDLMKKCLENCCQVIISQEKIINDLDTGCGDGDCGSTLKELANGIVSAMQKLSLSYPACLLMELAKIAENEMGGTSGAIYSLLFTTSARQLGSTVQNSNNWLAIWLQAWESGINGILKYSKAIVGDKTMMDVLIPSLEELKNSASLGYKEASKHTAKVAFQSCQNTKNMIPRAGRASYVKQTKFLKDIDAGAFAVYLWINAISNTLNS